VETARDRTPRHGGYVLSIEPERAQNFNWNLNYHVAARKSRIPHV
jgi:hypothetical protein